MKGKVLPYPAEVKTETFSEKYDGPTARLTKSFETGDPMRKGCSNSNKGDYNFEALAASNQTIAYSPLTAVHENKKRPDSKSGLSRRSDFGYERQC